MNTPYVKNYEIKNGIEYLTNPINKEYRSKSENRSLRRLKPARLFSNKKGLQMVVTKIGKNSFIRSKKRITLVSGNFRKDHSKKGLIVKQNKSIVNY